MGAAEMEQIGDIIAEVLAHLSDEARRTSARERVRTLCAAFPIYMDEDAVALQAGF